MIQTITQDADLGYKSPLVTPIVVDLTLKGGTYTNHDRKVVTFKDIILTTVLISVSQAKKIITTEIQGVDGTVKEYIGMDDYQISISGVINGPNGHYPIDETNTIHQLCKAAISIEVVSRYLQIFIRS